MPAWGPSRPLCHLGGFRVAAPSFVRPLPGGRRPLTHSPRREVVSRPAHTRGAHPTASGRHALAVGTQSLWDASPGVISQPPWSLGRFQAAPSFVPPLPGGRRPLTHSPRREVVSGPANTRGAHPTASGRLKTVVLFRQSYPALTNGGVDNAVVPCGTGALITQSYPAERGRW